VIHNSPLAPRVGVCRFTFLLVFRCWYGARVFVSYCAPIVPLHLAFWCSVYSGNRIHFDKNIAFRVAMCNLLLNLFGIFWSMYDTVWMNKLSDQILAFFPLSAPDSSNTVAASNASALPFCPYHPCRFAAPSSKKASRTTIL